LGIYLVGMFQETIKEGDDCSCVTEQMIFSEKINQRKQLLRTVFDINVPIHPDTRPHDPSATLHITTINET